MTPARHTNRLWLAANAFGATLRRDLVVTRRELPQFLVQALIQPMFFLLIFCKILPSIGLAAGNFAALLLPGIVGLTELMAAIQALETLTRPVGVRLHTDSSYVRNGITGWLHGWKRNGWRTAARQPVKNADLWQRLDAAAARHDVQWIWVKGHAGNPGNERADALANRGMEEARAGSPRR